MSTFITYRLLQATAAMLLALSLCACSPPADDDHGHSHDDDAHSHDDHDDHDDHADTGDDHHGDEDVEKTAVVTIWGDRFEVFMEYDYIVASEPVRFITHLTNLEDFSPRRVGPGHFRFVHRESGQTVEHTEEHVARDGIYLPEIALPAAGTWDMTIGVPVDGSEHRIDLPPVEVYASVHDIAHAPMPEEPEGISFLKEQQWKIPFQTAPVARQTMTERLVLTGIVSAPPGNTAVVTPPVAGKVLRPGDGRLPYVGDFVEEGTALARLQPPLAGADVLAAVSNQNQIRTMAADLRVKASEAASAASRAQIDLEQAEQVLARTEQLFEREAKSQRELEEARFAVREAENRLRMNRELEKTYEDALASLGGSRESLGEDDGLPAVDLRAPIEGILTEVDATVGEYVQPTHSLFRIVNTRRVFIEAKVPEADALRLSPSPDALYELPGAKENVYSVQDRGGRLVLIGATVDSQTRTVPVVYEVPNPDGHLRLGMAVTVHAQTDHAEDSIAIPESAIVEEDNRPVAFVQVSGETFQKRDLELGIRDGEYVQVLSGIDVGEHVVTKGAYAVRLASVSTQIPAHGHAH